MFNDDGTRFIELMEQLAERRSQREDEAQFPSHRLAHGGPNSHYHPNQPAPAPPPEEDDYEEGEEEYGSQEEDYDEEEDEEDDMVCRFAG